MTELEQFRQWLERRLAEAGKHEEQHPDENEIYERSPSPEKARAIALAVRSADKLNLLDANRLAAALGLLREFERERGADAKAS